MINSDLFNYVNVLDKAADASATRAELISNNIANVDTPNYKRQDLEFDSLLEAALSGGSSLDQSVRNIQTDLSSINGVIYTDNQNLSYRLDGNNVSIDSEEVYSTENQIRYQTLIEQMTQEFSRMKTVLK